MSFDQENIFTATVIKIVLPAKTLRICDGGFLVFGGEIYQSEDADFGTLAAGEGVSEGEGDEAPAASITFSPNSNAATETLSHPNMQLSPVSIHQVSVDGSNGQVLASVLLFEGFLDTPVLAVGKGSRSLEMSLISDTDRFFMIYEGNRMSQENHQRRWPGELGHNNMSGVEQDVAWGSESRPRSSGASSGGGTSSNLGSLFNR